MNVTKRQKRRIRNLVCIQYSIVKMLLVIAGFELLGLGLSLMQGTQSATQEIEGEVIWSEETKTEENPLIVCVDAGHGGKDNGSDYKGRYEKDDNLKLAQAVAAYLADKNVKVVMTRSDDTFLRLSERCGIANQSGADYMLSLHRNDGEGNGVETWISASGSEETDALANHIMEALDTAGIQRNRGVKKGTQTGESSNYYINVHSDMPSCIVEMGFINDASDNQLFDEKLVAYAAAIGDAVLATAETYRANKVTDGNGQGTGEAGSGAGDGQGTDGTGDGAGDDQGTDGTGNDTGDGQRADQTGSSTGDGQSAAGGNAAVQTIALDGLDTTVQSWGLGSHTDADNRPNDAVSAQQKYGDYHALFIGENTKTIYLTFDEGYEYGYTESILDTLKEKGVHAVFFVTEPYAKAEPALVQRMIDEGHVVGNHSVTHPSAGIPSLTVEQQQEEVMGNHQYIKDTFGYEMNLFRYPAGKFSEQSLAVVNNCGYESVFWSFAYLDYDVDNQPDQAESLQKMKNKMHPGAIYLLHAESATNAAVLGDLIDAAQTQGYSFGTL